MIGIPEKPDRNMSDHEYFCTHDDLFDRIQSSRQDRNIMWKFISNEPDKINLRVKQQRYTTTISKIRRIVLPKNQPSILFRERGKKQLTIGKNHFMTSG